ncbi:glycosyltransferase family 25 protein [Vibrio sp. 10N.286.51.E5]
MNIFVISLDDALERRVSIEQQFANIGQDFKFFDAVDGRKDVHPLFSYYNSKKRMRCKGYEMTPGELGCFASHYLLWEKCVELNEPIVVIEDDAQRLCFLNQGTNA